ncbi:MAG: DNA-directed RNA polymerase subunit N [Candidatus Syntrophoarchaeum sp. GoM_oil]|nr:MAG: DNA-directed RNA polymerase subunit N [Candidatus Syntrophoarchaeum sp. GoM_oil]
MIPVRCFTCGKVVGGLWEEYKERRDAGEDPGKVLDDLGVERYCCRRMLLAHLEIVDKFVPYQ